MGRANRKYRNVGLVGLDDFEYLAAMQRLADRHPGRGGPRAMGELLGGIVEAAALWLIAARVPLLKERVLRYDDRDYNGRNVTRYRELDGVWQIDGESVCLFEVKLTLPENMESGRGIEQLNRAADILLGGGELKYVLKRLVYVADEPLRVLDDVPIVAIDDEYEELGVIWFPPAEIERAVAALGLELPPDWTAAETRQGIVEEPERDEWRQFVEQETVSEPDGPLQQALRRAIEKDT